MFKGEGDYTVVVDFDAWGADDVRGRRWHSSQELTELGAGRLRVKLRLNPRRRSAVGVGFREPCDCGRAGGTEIIESELIIMAKALR